MRLLWDILFSILMLTSAFLHLPRFKSIKSRIFFNIVSLCICSVLFALGIFCQKTIINIVCFLAICALLFFLKKLLQDLEKQAVNEALSSLKKERTKSNSPIIDIGIEDYTNVND